jgi:glycosyltransferase involved in cell wall biosynthesis
MLQRAMWKQWRGVFDLFVGNSDFMRRRLEENGIGPAVAVWNGVPRRPARPPLAGPPLAAYAGRLSPEKGVEALLLAFGIVSRRLPEARLLVVGDGPERKRLEAIAAAEGLGARVTWAGHVPRTEVERLLDAAWVQVVPSLLEEPFGNAVAEALMRGTAVIATEPGGPAEIVRPSGGGLLVPPGRPEPLAEALIDVLGNRERSEELGAAGRAWGAERLSVEACADRFLALYRRLIELEAARSRNRTGRSMPAPLPRR